MRWRATSTASSTEGGHEVPRHPANLNLLCHTHGLVVGDTQSVDKARSETEARTKFGDGPSSTMNQHHAYAHCTQQHEVFHQRSSGFWVPHGAAPELYDQGLAGPRLDIGECFNKRADARLCRQHDSLSFGSQR